MCSKSQYETAFKNWNLRKNMSDYDYQVIIPKILKRMADGKETEVLLDGILVPPKRIKMKLRDPPQPIEGRSPIIPKGIVLRTPEVSAESPLGAGAQVIGSPLVDSQITGLLVPADRTPGHATYTWVPTSPFYLTSAGTLAGETYIQTPENGWFRLDSLPRFLFDAELRMNESRRTFFYIEYG